MNDRNVWELAGLEARANCYFGTGLGIDTVLSDEVRLFYSVYVFNLCVH